MKIVVEVDWSDPPLPRLVGPFDSEWQARRWGEQNIRSGQWNIAPLHSLEEVDA